MNLYTRIIKFFNSGKVYALYVNEKYFQRHAECYKYINVR